MVWLLPTALSPSPTILPHAFWHQPLWPACLYSNIPCCNPPQGLCTATPPAWKVIHIVNPWYVSQLLSNSLSLEKSRVAPGVYSLVPCSRSDSRRATLGLSLETGARLPYWCLHFPLCLGCPFSYWHVRRNFGKFVGDRIKG